MARESTINIRASRVEKETWHQYAPNGDLSKWFRSLADRDVKRQKRKR